MTTSTPPIDEGRSGKDEELVRAVKNALGRYTPLHIWDDSVHIDASGGKVILSGNVRSRSSKQTAEQIAAQVPGVQAVENRLIADADLELTIAQALAADPRTRSAFPGILVGVVLGAVYLKGVAPTPAIRAAAGQMAEVPGVRMVSNELTTPDKVPAVPGRPEAAVKVAA